MEACKLIDVAAWGCISCDLLTSKQSLILGHGVNICKLDSPSRCYNRIAAVVTFKLVSHHQLQIGNTLTSINSICRISLPRISVSSSHHSPVHSASMNHILDFSGLQMSLNLNRSSALANNCLQSSGSLSLAFTVTCMNRSSVLMVFSSMYPAVPGSGKAPSLMMTFAPFLNEGISARRICRQYLSEKP